MLGKHLTIAGLCAAMLILFLLSTPAMRAKATKHNLPQDTCKQGFVWREASPSDLVCVYPTVREQAAEDNRLAPYRRQL